MLLGCGGLKRQNRPTICKSGLEIMLALYQLVFIFNLLG